MSVSAPRLPAHRALAERLLRMPWLLLATAAMLASAGALALYSVAGGSLEPWAERHILRFVIGIGLAILLALAPIRLWLTAAYPIFFAALALLVLVPLLGTEALGARRWLAFAGFGLQPSEIMKVGLVLALARYYQSLEPDRCSHPRALAAPLLMIALPAILILRQPDLGTAALLVGTGLGVVFLAGVSLLYFAAGAVAFAASLPLLLARLHDYQRRRIEVFLDPTQDPLGAGYHITQSKIAVGSGGASGKGLLQGTQSQLDFVPEKQTDFIFSMIAEEWGWSGSVAMLALYALLLALLISMALTCRHQYGRLLIAGFALMIFCNVFVNIAMVAGLVPVVGVPLPLVSYGGTSMLGIMVALGLSINAYIEREELVRREDLRPLWRLQRPRVES